MLKLQVCIDLLTCFLVRTPSSIDLKTMAVESQLLQWAPEGILRVGESKSSDGL